MSKPTPGPFGSFRCGCTIGNEDGYISIVRCSLHDAATDLLEACKRLLMHGGHLPTAAEEQDRKFAGAAIAKAEGKS